MDAGVAVSTEQGRGRGSSELVGTRGAGCVGLWGNSKGGMQRVKAERGD
jgi:hypothetical protein